MATTSQPQITAAPVGPGLNHLLAVRQNGTPTCGWMNGNPCYTCAVNSFYGVHECCSGTGCTETPFPTACVGAATACNSDCQDNPLILKCNAPGTDACATRTWLGSFKFSGFGCYSEATVQTVYTTNREGFGETAQWYTFGERAAGPGVSTSSTSRPAPITSSSSIITTTSSTTTSTGKHSGPTSSFDVVALAAALGTVAGLAVLLILVFLLHKYRSRSRPRKRDGTEHLNPPVLNGSTSLMQSTGSVEKFKAKSSITTASPEISPYRGGEGQGSFPHSPHSRLEMDGSNAAPELYGLHSPVEAAEHSQFHTYPKYAPLEAGGRNLYEAPGDYEDRFRF